MKRMFDILVSTTLLIFLAPFFLLIALAIKGDSRGPVLYRQERVGKGARPFTLYKFRTLVADADKVGSHQTTFDDPRITRVGGFLRKTSLDELPQLVNVIKGEMSLVGPRPDVPAQRNEYTEEQWAKRTSVPPGITGLAQATLRSLATPEERTRMDLDYVDRTSLGLDLKILMMTVRQVLLRKGAN